MKKKADIIEVISDFQERVFGGNFSDIKTVFLDLADALERTLPLLTGEEQVKLVRQLNLVVEAYGDQDYLMVSDILEYEVRPLVERVCE